jgi:hypothetical protein
MRETIIWTEAFLLIGRGRYFADGYLSDFATSRGLSMPYAFAAHDLNYGHANDKPIELK